MNNIVCHLKISFFLLFISSVISGCNENGYNTTSRKIISLNGEWDIAKTDTFSVLPTTFESEVAAWPV